VAGLTSTAIAAAPAPTTPALITSPGLAPEGELVKLLCERAKIPVTYEPQAEAKDLARYKSLIIIIGGSGKGLGAAGVDVQDELKRADALLNEAKRLNLYVIGLHLGGEDRRGPASAKFIDLVTPRVNYLVVRADGNKDGVFTRIAHEKTITLVTIQRTQEVTDVLKKVYGL
jgi:hypothetical protein